MAVRLRHLETKDAPFMMEWMRNKDITRFLEGDFESLGLEDCEKFIISSAFRITRADFAIADQNDEYLGSVSLKNIDDEAKTAELSIVLRQSAIGTGAAAESFRQVMRIAFGGMGLKEVFIRADRRNLRAIGFYEKMGAQTVFDRGDSIGMVVKNREKIFVTRSSIPSIEEYMEEIRPVFDSCWLTNAGAKHNELRDRLKNYLGIDNFELVVNGHMALEIALDMFGLKEGEVITTPFTFVSTTNAIVRQGLKPVFCDVNPEDYTMDASKIEALITDKTVAIMPVHVYGNICDTEAIEAIAKKHDLKVIYDASHTFGEKYKGRGVAALGDASTFSFHATKVYNTVEGGAIACHSPELEGRIRVIRDFGIVDEETTTDIGPNAKMNEFAAAMGLCNLRHVDAWIAERKEAYDYYLEKLDGIKGIRLNRYKDGIEPNYAYFPIIVDEKEYGESRDELFERFKKSDIYARKYFYPLVSELDSYKNEHDAKDTPVALRLSQEVMTLPMYAGLTREDIDRIAEVIKNR